MVEPENTKPWNFWTSKNQTLNLPNLQFAPENRTSNLPNLLKTEHWTLLNRMAKMGDFFIKTEPRTCWTSNLSPKTEPQTYWTSNLPNLQKPNLELNQVRPNTNAHSSSSKDEKSEKKFSSIYALSRKFPELNSWTPCNYMQKRPLEDAWVQKKWAHSSSSKNVKSEKIYFS